MFDIIEATGYDIITGQIGDYKYAPEGYKSYFDIERIKDGFCYDRLVISSPQNLIYKMF